MQAHAHTWTGNYTPEWQDGRPPDITKEREHTGRLRSCSWCGSCHPTDLAAAIAAGARMHFADRKYGWPHKSYIDDFPNPHVGLPEIRSSGCTKREDMPEGATIREDLGDGRVSWDGPAEPAGAHAHAKFYTEHLQDATAEERAVIEKAMGLNFDFTPDGKVGWRKVA